MPNEATAGSNEKKNVIKIFGNDRLSDRVNVFQTQVKKNEEYQKKNPFSKSFQKGAATGSGSGSQSETDPQLTSAGLSKDDPRLDVPIF